MKLSMRRSRVLAKMRAGEVAYCYKQNLADARATEIIAGHGFDCIWTCAEHGPNDMFVIEKQILAAKCYDVDLFCRVPRGSYSDYIRPLEMDAAGIMVPHIMSLDDAKNVVQMTRFHPIGRRPADGGNADGFYCNIPFTEYIEQANRERFIILQIEDPEPLDELEAIADVEGYDILLFGPGDFSHAIGDPGNMDNPLIHETRERIAKVANKYGKFAGAVGDPTTRQSLIDMGYTFINVGADVIALSRHCCDLAGACGIETGNGPIAAYGGKE